MSKPFHPTGREHVFCWLCATLGNPREAALRAGYPQEKADAAAAKLLQRPEILREIGECANRAIGSELSALALRGLLRLAFGSANDIVKLAISDEEPDAGTLEGLDLFLVSEIKRPKGGGCEIKLHDRLAALELLLQSAGSRERPDGPGSFYAALKNSVYPPVEADEPDAL